MDMFLLVLATITAFATLAMVRAPLTTCAAVAANDLATEHAQIVRTGATTSSFQWIG